MIDFAWSRRARDEMVDCVMASQIPISAIGLFETSNSNWLWSLKAGELPYMSNRPFVVGCFHDARSAVNEHFDDLR